MNAAKTSKQRARRRATLIVGICVGVVILLLAGVYVSGYFLAGDKLPRNASVLGVQVGGLTPEEADQKLRTELKSKEMAPVSVIVGDDSITILPADAGMTIDYPATLTQAGAGRSWNPLHIWQVLTGGQDLRPVVAANETKLHDAARNAAKELDKEPVDATLAYAAGKIKRTEAASGRRIDAEAVANELRSGYLTSTRIEPKVTVTEPQITNGMVDAAVKDFAEPAIAAPVVVKAGANNGAFEVSPAEIADATTFVVEHGNLTPKVDSTKLLAGATKQIEKLKLNKPRDASWELKNGTAVVVPAQNGVGISEQNLARVVLPVLPKAGAERTVTVEVTKQDAKFTTDMAQKAKPTKVIGTFTTTFPHADYRNVNLGQVAKRVNGYVLRPGETFSMNEVVGQRSTANGFVDGYVIQGGRLKKEPGGGVSQGATTIFNAAFFAGLEDVEHHPHTLYFPRYPAGREATVYYGSLDLRFKNDTPNGVIITASRAPSSAGKNGSITVSIWGNSPYEIRSPEPAKSNYYAGKRIEDPKPDCEPQSPSPGFTATYHRVFIQGGNEVKRQNFKWTYSATDEIVCKKPE